MTLFVNLAAWLGVGARTWLTVRRGGRAAQWSVTLGLLLLACGITLWSLPHMLDAVAPNLALLLLHIVSVFGLASVLWWVGIISGQSGRRLPRISFVAAGVVSVVEATLWAFAPVHSRSTADLLHVHHTFTVTWHYVVFYLWCATGVAVTAFATARLALEKGPRLLLVRLGLGTLAVAATASCAAFLVSICRALQVANGQDGAEQYARGLSDKMLLIALFGFPLGILLNSLGGRITTRIRAVQTLRRLGTLHDLLVREQRSHVELPHKGDLAFRARRVWIEVHDALLETFVLPCPQNVAPEEHVAACLVTGTQGNVPAMSVLESASREGDPVESLAVAVRRHA